MAELYFDNEMKEGEIAEMLGVTESRVSQLLKPIKLEISAAAVFEERADLYRNDPGASLLAIRWIAI